MNLGWLFFRNDVENYKLLSEKEQKREATQYTHIQL